jgi:oligogalacturonide transporter
VLYYAGLSDVYSLLLLISAVAGLGRGGINYVPWNTYTYIADVDEVITGQRREGIFAGIMTLTRKASQAGAVMLVGIIMQMSGFVSGQKTQPYEVSHTILLILSVGTLWCWPAVSSSPCASSSICKPTASCARKR